MDLDANQFIATRFKITSIPAVMFFNYGELMETIIGVKTYLEFSDVVQRFLH